MGNAKAFNDMDFKKCQMCHKIFPFTCGTICDSPGICYVCEKVIG